MTSVESWWPEVATGGGDGWCQWVESMVVTSGGHQWWSPMVVVSSGGRQLWSLVAVTVSDDQDTEDRYMSALSGKGNAVYMPSIFHLSP